MPKINQEEYELIKLLPDYDWNWIAREKTGKILSFTNKPTKTDEVWKDKQTRLWFNYKDSQLFQFIQWEDEEPYNIAELIEEYEYSAEHVSHVVNTRVKALGKSWSESEETEAKKGIEWLKKGIEVVLYRANLRGALPAAEGSLIYDDIVSQIDQLDEPEVLSQEWIRINQERKGVHFFVNVTKLQNLIVPKREEITELDALNRLAQNVQFSADEIANHLEKLSAHNGQVTYGNQEILSREWVEEHSKSYTMEDSVEISDLQNLLVPKREEITEGFKETVRKLIETSELAMDVQKLTGMTLEEIKEEARNGGIVPKQEDADQAYKDGYEKGKQHAFYKGYLEGLADKEKEPETVASVIADFYKSFERFKEVISMEVEELEE